MAYASTKMFLQSAPSFYMLSYFLMFTSPGLQDLQVRVSAAYLQSLWLKQNGTWSHRDFDVNTEICTHSKQPSTNVYGNQLILLQVEKLINPLKGRIQVSWLRPAAVPTTSCNHVATFKYVHRT